MVLRKHWSLDPSVTFLNHGSFGACPIKVLEHQSELRAELEREPVQFFLKRLEPLMDEARGELARFVGADPDDLAFVPNATTGVSTVLRSLDFAPGDELLTTDHAYNSCRNQLDVIAARTGARVVTVTIPFPLRGPSEICDAILGAATPRTKIALVDHVTSATALVFPIERIVSDLAARGIDTIVDGAHAPGMLELDVTRVGAAYYTGNCHKWLCAPKGAAFLWVRRERQSRIRPLAISHGANSPRTDRSRFRLEFDWPGTVDPTAALSVPVAIRFLGGLLAGGWPVLRAQMTANAVEARRMLCEALAVAAPSPASMLGSMTAIPLPGDIGTVDPLAMDPLQQRLFDEHRIEVPVLRWPAGRAIRASLPVYATLEDVGALARALTAYRSSTA